MNQGLNGKAARNWVVANRETVVARYVLGKVPMSSLARSLGVSATWLTSQFDAWSVPRRGRAEASALRGPGVDPYAPG